MHSHLHQTASHERSAERLRAVYDAGLIAAEKKPFLIDLARSSGPFMAIDGGGVICDGASQIASLGLGFNAGALFGAAEYLESWTNHSGTETAKQLRSAYQELLRRKLGSPGYTAHFCSSGAEANETVLSHLFDRRAHAARRSVLAFEGSFHGRMMVTLASTWNKAKREPFAWPGHESRFAPYPIMEGDDVLAPPEPEGWRALWATRDAGDFEQKLAALAQAGDALLASEIEVLRLVRGVLQRGEVFAMLIEPMQCEGGDRYSSARFHQGLACLSCAFDTPLVYDEIQTGFGLGGEFFWHRKFDLRRPDGEPFFPAGVVCAKKSQAGVALLFEPETPVDDGAALGALQTSMASVARGYIQGSVISQFRDTIDALERDNRHRLEALTSRLEGVVTRPRVQGVAFAFDLDSPEAIAKLVAERFRHGLLYYPAGSHTARFRLNLGFKPADVDLFWTRLGHAMQAVFGDRDGTDDAPIPSGARDAEGYYHFHQRLIDSKLALLRGEPGATREDAVHVLEDHLAKVFPGEAFEVVLVDASNFGAYRDRVLEMQREVYEPVRQSTVEEFDALFASANPIGLLVLHGETIAAMAFAGPLGLFTDTRGVPEDPCVDDPTVAYVLDLTVAKSRRGNLGRAMKQALTMLAQAAGFTAIHGRNRDRMAAGMWAINLSLGSHTTKHLIDDYPDQGPFRDCLYYRCETVWSEPPIDLASGVEAPLGPESLNVGFVHRNLPRLVNKLTLSNFVTDCFLEDLEDSSQAFPEGLRRFYTASGLSEGVDKIVKVLWRHRQPRTGLLTIEGADFGAGSFMARSLSGVGDPYFPVERLPIPDGVNDEAFFDRLAKALSADKTLGVFVEPLMRRTMRAIDHEALRRIQETCRAQGVPLIYNESGSMFRRYSADAFGASGVEGAEPDATVAYLGGQMALVGVSEGLFIDEPLLLISTWDGDAFSLSQFTRAMEDIEQAPTSFARTVSEFHDRLVARVEAIPGAEHRLTRGVGQVFGESLGPLEAMLRPAGAGAWNCCPSYSEMLRFLRAQF